MNHSSRLHVLRWLKDQHIRLICNPNCFLVGVNVDGRLATCHKVQTSGAFIPAFSRDGLRHAERWRRMKENGGMDNEELLV